MGQSVAVFDGVGTIVLDQESQPDPTQQNFLWRKRSDGRVYRHEGGAWISPHQYPPGSPFRAMWVGTLIQLQTFDGGDTNPPGTNAGPMWEEDTTFAGRSPMGPGAITNTTPAKTLVVGEAYGDGGHTNTLAELVPHTHGPGTGADAFLGHASPAGSGTMNVGGGTDTMSMPLTASTGTGDAFNVVHPVVGVYVIKRTSVRANYTA